jgi:hypothetical protein
VFLDNLQVGFVPDPTTQCVPGAQLKRFELSLAPSSATKDVGTAHTVTATLRNVDDGSPVAGGSIRFDASGANTASGTATTNGAGQATFTYTGTVVGTDTISACYDVDSSGTCGGSDPFAPAVTVEWTNSPPVPDAGDPYTSDEGSAVALSGSATDVNGDPITYTWSAAPVSGVDAGASCSFADIHDETTTVTCTDDGVFRLTLTADDGRGGPVRDVLRRRVERHAHGGLGVGRRLQLALSGSGRLDQRDAHLRDAWGVHPMRHGHRR